MPPIRGFQLPFVKHITEQNHFMAKIKRIRQKECSSCRSRQDTLFRVRIEKDGSWIFVCEDCLAKVKLNNPDYQYGGTWKSKKRH